MEPFAWPEGRRRSACCGDSRERKDGNATPPTKMLQQPSAAKQTGRLKCRLPFPRLPGPRIPTKTQKHRWRCGVAHIVVFGTSDERQAWHGEQRTPPNITSEEVTLLWIKNECHHSHSSNRALQMISYRRTHPHLHTSSLSQAGRASERRRAGTVHCASGLCSSRPVSGPSYASRWASPKSCFGTGVVSSRTKNRSPIPCSRAKDTSQLV